MNDICEQNLGPLPSCGQLAISYTPVQQASTPAYDKAAALAAGTLFPGLDLPFMDCVPQGNMENTALAELMALDFVTHELELYLDTHRTDKQAFQTWKDFTLMAIEGRKRYAELYGPVTTAGTVNCDGWNWVCDPWPWDETEV